MNIQINKSLILMAGLVSVLSGCASITRGTTDTLEINSNPQGAQIEIIRDDGPLHKDEINAYIDEEKAEAVLSEEKHDFRGPILGTTPAVFKLKRKGSYSVTFKKPGYLSQTVQVTNKVAGSGSAGVAGNIIFGGIIGLGVDASTGAAKDLIPNPLNVDLQPE